MTKLRTYEVRRWGDRVGLKAEPTTFAGALALQGQALFWHGILG